jgi:hypothetical protein
MSTPLKGQRMRQTGVLRILWIRRTPATFIALERYTAAAADDEDVCHLRRPDTAGLPSGELIAVSHEDALDEFRGIIGDSIAIEAYRAGRCRSRTMR